MSEDPDSGQLLEQVARYYGRRLQEFGATPRGVDWNSAEGQLLRFRQLCRLFAERESEFSLSDLGCGYGSLFDFLQGDTRLRDYLGVDVSAEMIGEARRRLAAHPTARFVVGDRPGEVVDYCLASGIFNVKQQVATSEWESYFHGVLDLLNEHSAVGFAFNCLTSYSDTDRMRPDLFYANPAKTFDYCMQRYSGQVALLHDYGLYEFTILVRKNR